MTRHDWNAHPSLASFSISSSLTSAQETPITAALWETHSAYRPNQSSTPGARACFYALHLQNNTFLLLVVKLHIISINMNCFECLCTTHHTYAKMSQVAGTVFCVASQVNSVADSFSEKVAKARSICC